MNRSFIVAVLTVTMIIMMSTASYAVSFPHNFICDNCHGKMLGASGVAVNANNSCISCHSLQGEASRMPIGTDAMSNYYGTTSGQPATGSKSTHNWRASIVVGPVGTNDTPSNPAARVLEPQNTVLNKGFNNAVDLTNTVLCIRCHNAKGTSVTLGVDKPFLKVPNTKDELCVDCHRLRVTTTTAAFRLLGSHPVALSSYSAVYKLNTSAFRRTPLSPNANNLTAQLGNYLKSGKIVCSTCHAPHYADSSSATLDNRSTANGFAQDDPAKGLKGQFQNSKGQLLRSDPIGANPNSINICSSCHKETRNLSHNGKGQNIQCDNCHGAHVDYTGDGSAPNLYLVRRDFSNMSTAQIRLGSNVKVIYNTATSLRFKRADNKGICQICHTPTPGDAIHDVADTREANCIVCHTHANGFSAVSCTTCHGQPPTANTVGGPNGKSALSYSLDEGKTPHATHTSAGYYNYACKNCHYDGTRADSHNTLNTTGTATFSSVFIETAGSVGDLAGRKNVATDYDPAAKTCATVYCHSNGNPRGVGMSWKSATTPTWAGGKATIMSTPSECTSCHESGSSLNTNAHYKHVTTNSIKCYVCHAGTVNSGLGFVDRTKHANGTKDVSFLRPESYNSGANFQAAFNPADATCSNSCHTNGVGISPATPPKWTDPLTGACGTCHAAVPTTSLHPLHFTGTIGPQLGANPDCSSCHPSAPGTHANGVVELINSGTSCAPCHPSTARTPIWRQADSVTCESCHSGTMAAVVTNPSGTYTASLKSPNGHSNYSTQIIKHVRCTTCHDPAANHIGVSAAEKRLRTTGNALCASCHTAASFKGLSTAKIDHLTHGGTNAFLKYTTTKDGRAGECAGCHDTHGTTNSWNIRTSINGQTIVFTNITTGFYVTNPTNGIYNGLCQVCHTKTKWFRNNAPMDFPSSHNHTRKCLDCHQHKGTGIVFAFQGVGGNCGSCHGYPPVRNMTGLGTLGNYTNAKLQDYSGGGGAHTVAGHIPKTATLAADTANCTSCHYNTALHNRGGTPVKKSFVNVTVDPQYKFNNTTSITYNANKCSNVSCHFKASPNWTNAQ